MSANNYMTLTTLENTDLKREDKVIVDGHDDTVVEVKDNQVTVLSEDKQKALNALDKFNWNRKFRRKHFNQRSASMPLSRFY